MSQLSLAFVFVVFYLCIAKGLKSDLTCNVRARIESGWVCGLIREAELGVKYASFRGIPYGRQPLGHLRFKELEPAAPWPHHLDATEEGPICPQHEIIYGGLMKPVRGMSESCIFANVHVPIEALPDLERTDNPDYDSKNNATYGKTDGVGYPIFVFIHGGGFSYGSGDTDVHGPEYLVSKGFVVITFNYRINVFGFLSLNTPEIPGNAGLRDQLTLLRWVQRNARAFGGDPREVTLAGQSAGAASAHLLALSTETKGLFNRFILMSGTAIPTFYSASPVYANQIAGMFLKAVGINSTDPSNIHDQLINMPLEKIMNANSEVLYEAGLGLLSFCPVVESSHVGVTRMVDDEPINLIKRGRANEYPLLIGFTNNECETFKYRLKYAQVIRRLTENPLFILAARIPYSTTPNVALYLAKLVFQKYFHRKIEFRDYLISCSHTLFEYPAFQLVRWRGEMTAAPTYLYQFSYESDYSALKDALKMQYQGSAHIEDVPYIFRENAVLGDEKSFPPTTRDDHMKDWMTNFIVNFIRCNDPSCGKGWSPVDPQILNYQSVHLPGVFTDTSPVHEEWDMIHFHDMIDRISRNTSIAATLSTEIQRIKPQAV